MLKIKSYVAIFLLVFAVVAFTPPIFQSQVNGQNTGQMSPASCTETSCTGCIVMVANGACLAEQFTGTNTFTTCVYGENSNDCDQNGLMDITCDSGTIWNCNGIYQGGCVFDNCNCTSKNGVTMMDATKAADCAT